MDVPNWLVTRGKAMSRVIATVLPCLFFLSGCSGVPDCDSSRAEDLMESHVYTLVANAFDKTSRPALQKASGSEAKKEFPDAIPIPPRHQAILDAYHPFLSVDHDTMWLSPRLSAQMPERFQVIGLGSYLKMEKYKALRSALKVSLTDHEHLPDRTEGGRTYTKVCRARLWIEPTSKSAQKVEPITLIYSANSPPRTSVPIHIGINFFESSEAPLPFALTEMEKIELMMFGATRDKEARPLPQRPHARIQRVGLRALRHEIEAAEAGAKTSPGKTDGAARIG